MVLGRGQDLRTKENLAVGPLRAGYLCVTGGLGLK